MWTAKNRGRYVGPTVFAHAGKMGLEGIVSKRKDSMYRSGRSPDWLKMKNPSAPRGGRELESAALVGGPEPDGAHFFQFTSLVSLMSPL